MTALRFRSLLLQLHGVSGAFCSTRCSVWRWSSSVADHKNEETNVGRMLSSEQKLPIHAACVLARGPLIKPLPEDWEIEYHTWAEQIRSRRKTEVPNSWQKEKKVVSEEQDAGGKAVQWEAAPRITAADRAGDMKSLMRLLDRYLYLLVKHRSGVWSFPSAENRQPETIRQTGERALAECVVAADAFFIANWPIAHYRTPEENPRLEFYMKAQILSGVIEIRPDSGYEDYVWVSKNELCKYIVDSKLEELMKRALV